MSVFKRITSKLFDSVISERLRDIITSSSYASSPISSKATLSDIYASVYAFACIEKRAKGISGIETKIGKAKGEEVIQMEQKHWLSKLMAQPNNVMGVTFSDIKNLLQQWLDTTGNAYLYTPLDGAKYPNILWVLPATTVEVKYDDRAISHYEINGSTGIKKIPTEEILHLRTYQPSLNASAQYVMGTPKYINAVSQQILADPETIKYFREFMSQDAIPPSVLMSSSNIHESKWAVLKQHLKETIGTHAPLAILEGGIKIEKLPVSDTILKDIYGSHKGGLRESIARDICMAFETPYPLLTAEFANRSVSENTDLRFRRDVVDPLLTNMEQSFIQHFSQWESDIVIYHDKMLLVDSDVALKQQDIDYKYGVITRNEGRKSRALEPIDGGDELLIPAGLVPINVILEPTTLEKFYKSWENGIHWKTLDTILNPYREKIGKKMKKYFNKLTKRVIENIQVGAKDLKRVEIKSGIAEGMFLFDFNEWYSELLKDLDPEFSRMIKEILQFELDTLGYDVGLTEFEKEQRNALRELNAKMRTPLNTVAQEIRKKIQDVITSNQGATKTELLQLIEAEISHLNSSVYTKSRSEMIATTSATFGAGQTQSQIYKRLGFNKEWITQRDKKVRKTHRYADGQKADDAGNFHIGTDVMKHPAGGSEAAENVNCRCYTKATGSPNSLVNF